MTFVDKIGQSMIDLMVESALVVRYLGDCTRALGRFLRGRGVFRKDDFWRELGNAGICAVPIVCMISFMIGMIIAFVGVMELEMFGAEIFVAMLVTVAMNRIMGAIMMCIIMTGRTGASYAAEIGSMKINDEIDALQTMGVNPVDYLVLPRVFVMTMLMPVLTMIADVMGILGGAFVSIFCMGMSGPEYWATTMDAVSIRQFITGMGHGWVYGIVIALTGCWYGLRTARSADGVGRATTSAVVSSIVWCTILTAIITVILSAFGM